jgi:aryl-alcohol dehydrogenase-like predicted oxidoreductase
MIRLGATDLDVFPLCLGGNVFGWTADEQQSFSVLDAYAAAGGNFVDTADTYSGGASETIIGKWLAARGNRDEVVIATKVGGEGGLGARNIQRIAQESLGRLQTDRIDLYYAHFDDSNTPLEETLGAFDALVREGKVRHVAASNYTAPRLAEALAVSERRGLTRYVALQPHYNLVERDAYEGELAELCGREGLACLPYFALAKGFLTGKYRPGAEVESPRASRASAYLDDAGLAVLAALDEIAAAHRTTVAAVSLAWLLAQPTVAAPIASARTPAQLADWIPAAELRLSDEELQRLSSARARAVEPR